MTPSDNSHNIRREINSKSEIDISHLLDILYRRKYIFLISIISILFIVFIYNSTSAPVYESSVLLKKEKEFKTGASDELNELILLNTTDQIEAEIEILKSRTVLEKVVTELNLNFIISEIEYSNGRSKEIKFSVPEYEYKCDRNAFGLKDLPRFNKVIVDPSSSPHKYYITLSKNHDFELYDSFTDELLQSEKYSMQTNFDISGISLDISWPVINEGDRCYFEIVSVDKEIDNLVGMISITAITNTNLFRLTVKSHSPEMALLIATTVADKYRDMRLEQKRETIHYSFNFVEQQLQELADKLGGAEDDLSKYKSDHKIVVMDESSKKVVEFLSNMEAEKIKTDLELAEYQNKMTEMEKQVSNRGYFDQTFLMPTRSGTESTRTPFSVLLEQLSDAELKRLELLQKRKETHPDVVTIDEQISKLKSKLAEYNQNTLTAYEIIINTLKRKQRQLNGLIAKYSNRIENLPAQESKLAELMRKKNVYDKMFTLLIDKREELRMAELSKLQDITIIDHARLPSKPVGPRKRLNLLIGMFIGIANGVIAVVVLEALSKKIKTIDEIEKEFPFPILSILPKYNKDITQRIRNSKGPTDNLVTLMRDQLIYTEPFRVLRVKLENAMAKKENVILFTSSEENTGKTTIVANFAISLARAGKKVLIIDCDLRKPKIAEFYRIPKYTSGLLQFLTNGNEHPNIHKPFKENLQIIPAGGSVEKSSELLGSSKMKELIVKYHKSYDYVLLDTAPVTKIIDPLVLGRHTKNAVLVVRPNHTVKESISLAIEELTQVGMNVLGFVINACQKNQMPTKYRYGYKYGYSYHEMQET